MKNLKDYKIMMMNKISKRMIFILFVFLIACGLEDGTKPKGSNPQINEPETKKAKLILVFCDISNSVDESSIVSVTSKIKDIILSLGEGSKMIIYPIDNNDYPEKIGEILVAKPKRDENVVGDLKEAQEKKIKEEREKLLYEKSRELTTRINNKYKEILENKKIKQRSCIINTFRIIHEFFKAENKNDYEFEVAYLSDMIEQCNSNLGSIFMCGGRKGDTPTKKEVISEKISTVYKPNFNLKELIGNNVSIVITTRMLGSNGEYQCLNSEDHREIWKNIFNKVGYSDEDFDQDFSFRNDLPPKFRLEFSN